MGGGHKDVPDVPMHPKKSIAQYPRLDNVYEHKRSFNFDMMRTRIFANRTKTHTDVYLWIAHGIVGVMVAAITWAMTTIEDFSAEFRSHFIQNILDRNPDSAASAWAAFVTYAVCFVLIACLLTIYVGPGANGSGIAEIMGLLNGINYPNAIGIRTLIVKIVGTIFAVSGGLCIGKEGPLAHIGANVGALTCHLPIKGFYTLRNDVIKRQMIAAGASAGVSAAFGAPIGGALFSYEISKPNTFWTFSMLWRVFSACSICTFLLGIFNSLWSGATFSLNDTGALKFGKLDDEESSLLDLPAAIIIGVVCGLLGSFFIYVNINLGILRKRYIKENWQKIAEAMCFAFVSSTIFFCVVLARQNNCRNIPEDNTDVEHMMRFRCPEVTDPDLPKQFNPLATLIFNTEGGTIRQLLQFPAELKTNQEDSSVPVGDITIYFIVWYGLTIVTYGVWVPAGLFLPGILIGCSVGIMYMDVLVYGFNANIDRIGGQSYIIIGATAMLAAYCRLTYSLAVIMLETTQSINNFLPTLLAIGISLGVAKSCNRSLYEYAIRAKQMPLLRNHMPEQTKDIRVKELLDQMPQEIQVVESVCQVERLAEVCTMGFSSIPVVNMAGRIIGIVPKNFVIVLIENHIWYDEDKVRGVSEAAVSMYYKTAMKRHESMRLSDMDATSQNDLKGEKSPRGSIHSDDDEPFFGSNDKKVSPEEGENPNNSTLQKNTPSSQDELEQQANNAAGLLKAKTKKEEIKKENVLEYSIEKNEEDETLDQIKREKDERNQTMIKFTGERDYEVAPQSENILHWHYFCSDFYSTDRSFTEVADIAQAFSHRYIDLRPYMLEQPYVVLTTDKLPKCLDLFRHMHLRALPVNDPNSGKPVAILTRQDIFSYMSL